MTPPFQSGGRQPPEHLTPSGGLRPPLRETVAILLALSLTLPVLAADPLTDAELLARAETAFQQGLATRATPRSAREHFAQAAADYGTLRQRGDRSAALLRNQGNAYLLAGELPRAILAYRRGLHLAPGDRRLRSNLAYARQQVISPNTATADWLSGLPRP